MSTEHEVKGNISYLHFLLTRGIFMDIDVTAVASGVFAREVTTVSVGAKRSAHYIHCSPRSVYGRGGATFKTLFGLKGA